MDERTFQELIATPILQFSVDEARALWRFLSHEYISYEDTELLDAVRKLSRFVQANE